MATDDIRNQIESLRAEVRDINHILINLRYDDIGNVYAKQIRSVQMEKNERFFHHTPKAIYAPDDRDLVDRLEREVAEMIDALVSSIVHDNEQNTMALIDKYRSTWRNDERLRGWPELDAHLQETLRQIAGYVDTSALMRMHVQPWQGDGSGWALDPDAVEKMLAPLSSAVRVRTMVLLSREPLGLTEICRRLDMQKGHLQFHLRTLLSAKLIQLDKRTKLYSISPKGLQALDSVAEMTSRMT